MSRSLPLCAQSYWIGSGISGVVVDAGIGAPGAGGVKTQATRRACVAVSGGLRFLAMPAKKMRPLGSRVAWIGEAYQPSAVRNVDALLHASETVPGSGCDGMSDI